jgi:hypothetical protein
VNKLKSGKAAGLDKLSAEMFKHGYSSLSSFLRDLFNDIHETAEFPSEWQRSILHAIHKKGDQLNPQNYRGLAIISAFSKPLLTIIGNRIKSFCENRDLLIEEQGGFRPKRWTVDNIYALNCYIRSAMNRNSKLYCLFIDYSKCFDMISRPFLWKKLMNMGFSTKMVKLLMALYSRVEFLLNENTIYGDDEEDHENELMTENVIKSTVGLKQGCPLSPLLFTCFTNDAVEELTIGLTPTDTTRPPLLLFADDMIMFSESPEVLRTMIKNLETYTSKWGLSVNLDKTQIVAFRRLRGKAPEEKFFFKSKQITIVDSYQCLGVTVHYTGSWNIQIQNAKTKGIGSLFN